MRTTSVARPHLDEAKRTEASLTKNHKEGQGYSSRKALSVLIGNKLGETSHSKKAKSVIQCADFLELLEKITTDNELISKIICAFHCDFRLCSVCQHRRQNKWKAKAMNILENLRGDYRKTIPILLTLTVPNCDVTELRETIDWLNRSFKKLTGYKDFPGKAWVKTIEITKNQETGLMHPHIHVMLLVSPSYFQGSTYWSHKEWKKQWGRATGYPGLIANVKRIRYKPRKGENRVFSDSFQADLSAGLTEVVKYCVKGSDLVTEGTSAEFLDELVSQIKNLKFISVGGFLRQFLKECVLKLEPDTEELGKIREIRSSIYKYNSNLKDYLLTEIRSKTSSN